MIESVERHAALSALDVVAACRARLTDLNRAMQRGQWHKIAGISAEYSTLFAALAASEKSPQIDEELVQLDILQRRCMRQLARYMKAVSEDIASIEAGQKRVQRSRELVDAVFKQ